MMDHDRIYRSEAERYDRMIAREDREGNLMRMIRAVAPDLDRLNAADIGTGTGRLARMLAPRVRSILATDASQAMLDIAAMHLRAEAGTDNWKTVPGTNDKLPIADKSIDLLTAGWTICYSASSNIPDWEGNLARIVDELSRVLKLGGTAILFENYGTGASEPNPPDFLRAYFCKLEQDYGFDHACIRTDYEFESPEEAAELTDFFFGSDISREVVRTQSRIVPECTGVWWKRF
ncbi:class I SAM-dependent methyltransferase [Paenibacillus glycinis]|uniref:Methyltransferase domain-containing protein n=1 Tax=Paenibacillus glycinis TaxID=2697035 RepID=A0ABW9XUT5_9BACL|nr:class I SAM-dependent methyltransferase [Paenibacillus glycinis]NBD26428.1 methyltransferase domain-containing protein [Paenibacillus glycinis]